MRELRNPLVVLLAVFVLAAYCGSQAAEQSEIDSVLREAVDRGDVPGVVAMAPPRKSIESKALS